MRYALWFVQLEDFGESELSEQLSTGTTLSVLFDSELYKKTTAIRSTNETFTGEHR